MPTVMITGANRGIGLEFTRQYAADGWTVIATCRNPIGVGELATLEGDIQVHGLNVTDPIQLERLGRDLDGMAIDLLINNAGIYGERINGFEGLDEAGWLECFRINTIAPLNVSRTFLPHVAKAKGKIVTLGSILGSVAEAGPNSASYPYRTSKAAVNMVTNVFAQEVEDQEVTVLVVHPGWVQTDMGGENAAVTPKDSVAGLRKQIAEKTLKDTGSFFAFDGRDLPW